MGNILANACSIDANSSYSTLFQSFLDTIFGQFSTIYGGSVGKIPKSIFAVMFGQLIAHDCSGLGSVDHDGKYQSVQKGTIN